MTFAIKIGAAINVDRIIGTTGSSASGTTASGTTASGTAAY
jgi:hypothetical protein